MRHCWHSRARRASRVLEHARAARAADSLAKRVHALEPLAGELHLRDRAWFYSRFHVDEVIA
jgi:hypothetical protein